MRKEKFNNLFQFLAGYFNQDFSIEFGEPEIAVRKFIEDTDAVTRDAVALELRQMLAETDDHELEDVVFELGCYYSPQRHRHIAMRRWLEQVVEEIQRSINPGV